jgi:hypothetical protein
MIEHADERSRTNAMFRSVHPSVISAVNRRRAVMGLELINVPGDPSARPIQRRGGPSTWQRLSPAASLAASRQKAAAAIARLRRVQAGR